MGHLDNRKTIVEARLTTTGREILAEEGELDITQFAVADDEINYDLWQEEKDDDIAGDIIENTPLFEAFADERQSMRFRLIALEEEIGNVPIIDLPAGETNLSLDEGESETLAPTTELDGEKTNLDGELGYTAIVEDSDLLSVETAPGSEIEFEDATLPIFLSDRDQSESEFAIGSEFVIEWDAANADPSEFENDPDCPTDGPQTRVIIVGNETGLSVVAEVSVVIN